MSAPPLIFGHRGAAGLAPENSLSGFARAVALGLDGVECDAHPSADGVPMVIHDAALGRTTDDTGPVAARTARQLARVRLRRDGGPVPTLAAVCDLLRPSVLLLNVELKTAARGRRYSGLEHSVADVLRATGMIERAIVSSFDWQYVTDFLAVARPRAALGLLGNRGVKMAGGLTRALARAQARGFDGICVPAESLKRRPPKPADRARIWVYAADDELTLRRMIAANVAGVISDRPDLALRLRDGA